MRAQFLHQVFSTSPRTGMEWTILTALCMGHEWLEVSDLLIEGVF
jgi:hypothetical protein